MKQMLDQLSFSQIYRGYVSDDRNTDNAWIETSAVLYHDEQGQDCFQIVFLIFQAMPLDVSLFLKFQSSIIGPCLPKIRAFIPHNAAGFKWQREKLDVIGPTLMRNLLSVFLPVKRTKYLIFHEQKFIHPQITNILYTPPLPGGERSNEDDESRQAQRKEEDTAIVEAISEITTPAKTKVVDFFRVLF